MAVAGEVAVEEVGKVVLGCPAALVVDADGIEAAEFGVVVVEGVLQFGEIGAAVLVDAGGVFGKQFVKGTDLRIRPVGAQGGVAVFQGVLVALPGGKEAGFGVKEAVVGKAPAMFGALVDEGEVVGVDDFDGQQGGELAQVFQVFAVEAQAVFVRAFFHAETPCLSVARQGSDEAKPAFVVGDDVAGLVFAEGFAAPQGVERFEECGFAGAVVAADEVDVGMEGERLLAEVAKVFGSTCCTASVTARSQCLQVMSGIWNRIIASLMWTGRRCAGFRDDATLAACAFYSATHGFASNVA